jgi:hypothetical protein
VKVSPASTNHEAFPFLRLPLELRLIIYSYLFSDNVTLTEKRFGSRRLARRNRSSSSRAIMRVNREIHHEFTRFYYSTACFWFILRTPLHNLGEFTLPPGLLQCLGKVRILNLSMDLQRLIAGGARRMVQQRREVSALLASGSLEQLNLHLTWVILYSNKSDDNPRACLKHNLSALQQIRGLKVCTISIKFHTGLCPTNWIEKKLPKFKKRTRKYLDSLERDLMGNDAPATFAHTQM